MIKDNFLSSIKYPLIILACAILMIAGNNFFLSDNAFVLFGACALIGLGIPVAYLLENRFNGLNRLRLLFTLIIAFKIAAFVLSKSNIKDFGLVSHILSAVIILLLLFRLIVIVIKLKNAYDNNEGDFVISMGDAFQKVFSSVVQKNVFVPEISIIYYAFVKWQYTYKQNDFSYYRKSGILTIYYVIIFLFLIEAAALHLLLFSFHLYKLAIALTILSFYSIIFIIAHIKAMKHRPVTIQNNTLILKCGLLTTIYIPFEQIESVISYNRSTANYPDILLLGLLKNLENYNVLLELKQPINAKMLLKNKKGIKYIHFRVDNNMNFVNIMNAGIF